MWSVCVSGMRTVRWEMRTLTHRSPRSRRRSCVWSAPRSTPAEGLAFLRSVHLYFLPSCLSQGMRDEMKEIFTISPAHNPLTSHRAAVSQKQTGAWLDETELAGAWSRSDRFSHLISVHVKTRKSFKMFTAFFASLDSRWWICAFHCVRIFFIFLLRCSFWMMTCINIPDGFISEFPSDFNFPSFVAEIYLQMRRRGHIVSHVYAFWWRHRKALFQFSDIPECLWGISTKLCTLAVKHLDTLFNLFSHVTIIVKCANSELTQK